MFCKQLCFICNLLLQYCIRCEIIFIFVLKLNVMYFLWMLIGLIDLCLCGFAEVFLWCMVLLMLSVQLICHT